MGGFNKPGKTSIDNVNAMTTDQTDTLRKQGCNIPTSIQGNPK
jgi:hypothetical protein